MIATQGGLAVATIVEEGGYGKGGGNVEPRALAAPLSLSDHATMVSATVDAAALATCTSFCEAVGERRVGSVTLEQVKRLLTQVELFSKDNNQLNWHVHVSGYDKKGKLFWLPIYEDDAVLQSAAANVLGQVYRYVESGSCMEATATSIMTHDKRPPLPTIPSLRTAPPLTLPPGAIRARAVDGNARTDVGVGGGSHVAAGSAASGGGASGALADAQGGSVPIDPVGAAAGNLGRRSAADAQLAAAQVAAAAVVDRCGDNGEDYLSAGPPLLVPLVASPPAAAAVRGTSLGFVVDGRVGVGTFDAHVDDPVVGLDDDEVSSGEEDENRRAAAAGARPTNRPAVKRRRRDWKPTAPSTTHPPADYLPSASAMAMAHAVITASDGVTMLRRALVIGNKAVAGSWSWQRTRLSLPWWPCKSGTEQLWPLTILVNNSLIKLANPKHKATEGAMRVTLPWLNIPRGFAVERRIGELLLLVDKSGKAHAAIKGFILTFKPTLLPPHKARTSQGPSLSGLSALRAAPRIAPSPGTFARQRADPQRPGELFFGATSRPPGWVAKGSPKPTSQTRMAPPDLPAPLPPHHPAARTQAAKGATSSATSAATDAREIAEKLRATLLARAAAKKQPVSVPSSGSGASSAALPGASPSMPQPPSAALETAASSKARATKSAAAPPSTRRSPTTATPPPKQGSAGTRSSATPAATTRRVAALSAASHVVAPGGTRPASTTPTASATGSAATPACAAPSPSLPPEGMSRTSLSRPSSPAPKSGGAASAGSPSTVAASKATTHQSAAPAEPIASGAPSPAHALPQTSRTTLSRPSTLPLPGGRSSLELSPTAVAASAVTTHQVAAASSSVTNGSSASDSPADSDSSKERNGTSTRGGASSRRPPLPPPLSFPGGGRLAAPKHHRREGAEERNKVRANARVKLGTRADARAGTTAGSKAGTKADAKAGTTAAAKTGTKPGANEGSQAGVKIHSKAGGKPVANLGAKMRAEASTNTTSETTGAETHAGARVPTHVVEGGRARSAGTTTNAEPPAAEKALPTPAGSRARRGRSAFGLAADALRRTTRSGKGQAAAEPAAALPGKRPAAGELMAGAVPPLKRSRRIVAREQQRATATRRQQAPSAASDVVDPALATVTPAVQLGAVPNRATCTLLSELGVPVATGRLEKERRKVGNRWIDKDMVAVELCSVLEPSVSYPYHDRYPLASKRSTAMHLDDMVGTTVAWSLDSLTIE